MEYLSIQDISDRWNISKRRIQILCRDGRIEGARRIGNIWAIPGNTEKPTDARIRNPIIEKKSYSQIRSDLKKLLKVMYKRSTCIGISGKDKKAYVLSVLAGSLIMIYLKKTQDKQEIYQQIYRDISGKELVYLVDQEMLSRVNSFIFNHKEDEEIENVVSWAYQYSNKILETSAYSQTQFFTEKYMIKYLVGNIDGIAAAQKILDPCSGGGNFLVECLDVLCGTNPCKSIKKRVIANSKRLYGYDIDDVIAKIAVVNIRIKAFAIMYRHGKAASFSMWNQIMPNIYCKAEEDMSVGSLAKDNRMVRNVLTGDLTEQDIVLGNADIIVTNPPFASAKGMSAEQKAFLKENYPLANCDTCVAFMEAVGKLLSPDGICGMVSQNAWMHLQSFRHIREKFVNDYKFKRIANLGSGAFMDLSGEKSNVSLLIFGKKQQEDKSGIIVQNLLMDALPDKMKKLEREEDAFEISQEKINGVNGFILSAQNPIELDKTAGLLYSSVAVPMQGTSTGNAKELVGYFWEHFGEREWIPVSNGGGYCRWEGLNHSVVKWGNDGEYIRAQKGSALRNSRYFDVTKLVFSDTGTAGLNVRVLLDNQIFIASGPGIRILSGNEYAHMAFLNSRLAADYVRTISPKLTIAAGYIGRIPIKEAVFSSAVLERNAKLCVELKRSHLKERPNNLEYAGDHQIEADYDVDEKAWVLFKNDLSNELLKLEIESRCDDYIIREYGLDNEAKAALTEKAGECAFDIKGNQAVDVSRLDKYFAKMLDDACMLKRSRTSKASLGCDGVLEFASKDLHIHPASLVEQICKSHSRMKVTLAKYKDLLIHNQVLKMLGYSVVSGIQTDRLDAFDIIKMLNDMYGGKVDAEKWAGQRFNIVHSGIFKGKPFLYFKDGRIKHYDR